MATHFEYISDLKFNSSFKNMLRDYYTYGFKDRSEYSVSRSTYDKDRNRLKDFLRDYMEWSEWKERKNGKRAGKNITFISCDSQSMSINPFHRVYRFCGTNRPDELYYFFHTLAALSSLFQLEEGTDTLNIHGAVAARFERKVNMQEKMFAKVVRSMHIDSDTADELGRYCNDEDLLVAAARKSELSDEQIGKLRMGVRNSTIKLKTSELLRFCEQNFSNQNNSKAVNNKESLSKTANNRLQRLNDIGIIQCDQRKGKNACSEEQNLRFLSEVINILLAKENMKNELDKALESYTPEKSGDRNWYLSKLTIKRLLEAGEMVDERFCDHIRHALDFYSKTFLFGEIGTFLLDRMKVSDNSAIRIKHEYYMHSLNDFNAIDLMAAIENNKWCLVSYKRDDIETKILCYPIELRISSVNGREYLMYYEPFKGSCASCRLEFIEAIQYYQDCDVKECMSRFLGDPEIEFDIDRNLKKAKLLLEYTWGASTGLVQERNVDSLETMLREIRVRIDYNKETDYYILNRIYRESRIGRIFVNEAEGYIDYIVMASNIKEIIPFIRSYYSRVISCTGYDKGDFSIEMDVDQIVNQVVDKVLDVDGKNLELKRKIWKTDAGFLAMLGDGMKAEEHDKLFNEIYSTYYHIFSAIFSEVCCIKEDSGESGKFTGKELDSLCREIMEQYKDKCGLEMLNLSFNNGKNFAQLLKTGGFLLKENRKGITIYKSKYETLSKVDLYRDVIPLAEIEIRWLKTIIEDEKIHYFMNEKEIMAMKLLFAEMAINIKAFPMSVVNYYDRYKFSAKKEWRESTVLVPVLDAIDHNHVVRIKYVSNKKNIVSGNYKPILVEYSKRDNRFVGYFLSCREKEGLKEYPLAQIVSVGQVFKDGSGENKTFDMNEAKKKFEEYKAKQQTSVELEFSDNLNLVDRILNEFSPWDKRCEFDAESGIYHLTISYPKKDGKDMAIRLLSYGSAIRFVDKDHVLAKVVQGKLRTQMQRMQKQVVKPVRREAKSDEAR